MRFGDRPTTITFPFAPRRVLSLTEFLANQSRTRRTRTMSDVSPIIENLEKTQLRKNPMPEFRVGDTVRVWVLIKEGDKERAQAFEGVVICRQHGSARASFTVRKISYGVGVERVFPVHSP